MIEGDLEHLFIIPVDDWYADTGGTFRLVDTLPNLKAGRTFHFDKVERLVSYFTTQSPPQRDGYLILVATDVNGSFTIIDGTHRAAALLRMHQTHPNLPWKALLMQSPSMRACRWHIGSDQMPGVFRELRARAIEGKLN